MKWHRRRGKVTKVISRTADAPSLGYHSESLADNNLLNTKRSHVSNGDNNLTTVNTRATIVSQNCSVCLDLVDTYKLVCSPQKRWGTTKGRVSNYQPIWGRIALNYKSKVIRRRELVVFICSRHKWSSSAYTEADFFSTIGSLCSAILDHVQTPHHSYARGSSVTITFSSVSIPLSSESESMKNNVFRFYPSEEGDMDRLVVSYLRFPCACIQSSTLTLFCSS